MPGQCPTATRPIPADTEPLPCDITNYDILSPPVIHQYPDALLRFHDRHARPIKRGNRSDTTRPTRFLTETGRHQTPNPLHALLRFQILHCRPTPRWTPHQKGTDTRLKIDTRLPVGIARTDTRHLDALLRFRLPALTSASASARIMRGRALCAQAPGVPDDRHPTDTAPSCDFRFSTVCRPTPQPTPDSRRSVPMRGRIDARPAVDRCEARAARRRIAVRRRAVRHGADTVHRPRTR